MKTAALAALVAAVLAGAAAAGSIPVTVDPATAAVGETIVVSGPLGVVSLEPLDSVIAPVPLGRMGTHGTLSVKVPDVPRGRYRVVVPGSNEAPVLEVVKLGRQTSLALLVFGFLFVIATLVGGLVVHRRWRDAIS
ncbi:MAG TPA: hypothetical protein VM049_11230 [Gaiellaceae bacterium]|nr:hypothetical protein [Gaiellaceae bacterium]